jgi:hypothetical protein
MMLMVVTVMMYDVDGGDHGDDANGGDHDDV